MKDFYFLDDYFFPFREIKQKNDRFFAGEKRIRFLSKCIDRLSIEGSSIVIYGDRKVGKTSFANQLMYILNDESSLVRTKLIKRPPFKKKPVSVFFKCSKNHGDVKGMLAHLIVSNDRFSLRNLFPLAFSSSYVDEIVKKTREFAIDIKLLKGGYKIEKEKKKNDGKSNIPDVIVEDFTTIVNEITAHYPNDQLYLFIDEFDRLLDSDGMGEVIKNHNSVQFVVIGVSESVDELIKDHRSVFTQTTGNKFKLPAFTRSEIAEIYRNVERFTPFTVKFLDDFIDQVYEDCGGLPVLAHIVGLNSLKLEIEQKSYTPPYKLNKNSYDRGIDNIFNFDLYEFSDEIDEIYMNMIRDIVRDKPNVKAIIFTLANFPAHGIDEDELFREIPEENNVGFNDNLKMLVKTEFLKQYKTGKIRFSEPLLRIAVNLIKKYNIKV